MALATITSNFSFATVYTYNIIYDTTTQTCGTTGKVAHCFQVFAFTLATDNPGDVFDINVTFNNPLHVAGSSTRSKLFDGFYDTNATWAYDAPNAETYDTLTVVGYVGRPGVITGGYYSYNNSYYAAALFTKPSGGFSVTGYRSAITVVTKDPFSLVKLIVGTQMGVPEPSV